MNHLLYLADFSSGAAATTFWGTGLGKTLSALMVAVGILVVIGAAVRCIGKVTSGKPQEAVKTVLGAAVLSAFLFDPALISSLIGAFGSIVSTVISSFSTMTNSTGK